MKRHVPRMIDPRILTQAVGDQQTMDTLMAIRFRRRLAKEIGDYLSDRVTDVSTTEEVEAYCIRYAQDMEALRTFEGLGVRGYRFVPTSETSAAFYFFDQDKKQIIGFHFSWNATNSQDADLFHSTT